jgi:hypothetical protein
MNDVVGRLLFLIKERQEFFPPYPTLAIPSEQRTIIRVEIRDSFSMI